MPLGTCRDCGTEVSTSAEVCPKCGARNPSVRLIKLTVARLSKLQGFAISWGIYIDDLEVGKLGNGEQMDLVIPSGPHKFEVKAVNTVKGTNVLFEENHSYKITLRFASAGFWGPKIEIDVAKV